MSKTKTLTYTDEEYLIGHKNGNNAIFQALFNHYYKLLVARSFKTLREVELPESVVQEVFVNLWGSPEKSNISNLKAYLIVSVKNRSLNEIAKQKNFLKYKKEVEASDFNDQTENQPDTDLLEQIMQVIDELPEQQKKVFKMNRLDGLKYSEIAEALGLSIKTIEAHMSKALSFTRERLISYKELVTLLILTALF